MTEDQLAEALVTSTVDRVWKELDKTNDGLLTYEECKNFLGLSFGTKEQLPFMESETRQLFSEVDSNKDGSITKGEMRMFILRLTHF